MKKKKEETYELTVKGFLSIYLNNTEEFMDALELWLRRTDKNAVILTKAGEFEAHKVYLEDK